MCDRTKHSFRSCHRTSWQHFCLLLDLLPSSPFIPFSAAPPGPSHSLARWSFLPEFLHTSVPVPDPLLCLPFTKAQTSLQIANSLRGKSTKRRASAVLLLPRTPHRFLLLLHFLLLTSGLLRERLQLFHQSTNISLVDHGVLSRAP